MKEILDCEELTTDDLALVSLSELTRLLSYPSVSATRAALRRGFLLIPVFQIPKRRGLFAHRYQVNTYLKKIGEMPIDQSDSRKLI